MNVSWAWVSFFAYIFAQAGVFYANVMHAETFLYHTATMLSFFYALLSPFPHLQMCGALIPYLLPLTVASSNLKMCPSSPGELMSGGWVTEGGKEAPLFSFSLQPQFTPPSLPYETFVRLTWCAFLASWLPSDTCSLTFRLHAPWAM